MGLLRESGASAGTIYLHFVDKDDLIHALYRHVKTIFYRAMVVGHAPTLPHAIAFRQMWLHTYNFYITHHIEARFIDHYENSPYYHPEIPTGDKVEEEENLPALFRLIFDDDGQLATKDLPLDALYEISIGVAVRLAKNRRAGMPALDEHTLENIAEGKTPFLPDMSTYFVDVRDCAAMHIAIMNNPATNGHRHLCYSVGERYVDLAIAIRNNYATRGFSPSTRTVPKFLMWIMKFFSTDVASIYPLLGKVTLRESKYPAVYQYRYTDFSQMVRDTMDDLLEKKAIGLSA